MLKFDIVDKGVRALPPYQTYLKAQKTFVLDRYRRFLGAQGHESPGIKLLRYILQFVDMDYLRKQKNNYDRYRYHLRFIRKDLYSVFDRVQRGGSFHELFFKSQVGLTAEYLLPVEDLNAIVNLPLDTESWDVWKTVKPLRLWAYDSDEFTVNIINDRVHFVDLAPSYAIELLDVIALVFKYFIWYEHQRDQEQAQELALYVPQQLFLHKYVFCDWCWDLTDAWILNQLSLLPNLQVDELNQFSPDELTRELQYGRIALGSENAFRYLHVLLDDATKNMRPEVIFGSKLLTQGSIYDRIRSINEELTLPIHSQYDWLRWLRDRDLYKFFCGVWSRSDLPTAKTYFINWRRDFKRTLNHRPWNVCNNIVIKTQIEQEMREFYDWLESQ